MKRIKIIENNKKKIRKNIFLPFLLLVCCMYDVLRGKIFIENDSAYEIRSSLHNSMSSYGPNPGMRRRS